jgi:hypothetical protein
MTTLKHQKSKDPLNQFDNPHPKPFMLVGGKVAIKLRLDDLSFRASSKDTSIG